MVNSHDVPNLDAIFMECLVSARYIQSEIKVSPFRDFKTGNLKQGCLSSKKIQNYVDQSDKAKSYIDDDRREIVLRSLFALETGRETEKNKKIIREVLKPCELSL